MRIAATAAIAAERESDAAQGDADSPAAKLLSSFRSGTKQPIRAGSAEGEAMPNGARTSISRLLAGVTFFASSLTTSWAAGDAPIKTLRPGILQVCLYAGFAPFTYKENGVWKGWDLDYLTAFASANGLAIEVIEEPQFEGIWLKPGEGKCDIAGSGISDTAERRTAVNSGGCWSRTYYETQRR